MSLTLNRSGNIETPETTVLTTTNATVIHTASEHYRRVIEQIILCNVDNSNAVRATLAWNDGSTDTTFWNGNIAAGETEIVEVAIITDGKGGVMSLKATASAADDLNVTVISSAQSRTAPSTAR